MNQIHIEQLKVNASIGCEPFEKHITQPLFINIDFEIDIEKASKTDDINDTINYAKLCQFVTETATCKHYNLIETLAQSLADALEKTFALTTLQLRIAKPTAIKDAKTVAVSLRRQAK